MAKDDWLIWSNEHHAWWGPGRAGYTTLTHMAGRYSKEEADRICEQANCWIPRAHPPNEVACLAPETASGDFREAAEQYAASNRFAAEIGVP